MTADDFIVAGSNTANSNAIQINSGLVQSKEPLTRPLTLEAKIKSTEDNDCVGMTFFASEDTSLKGIGIEIGGASNKFTPTLSKSKINYAILTCGSRKAKFKIKFKLLHFLSYLVHFFIL